MNFQIDPVKINGVCDQCGVSDAVYKVTVSTKDRSVSKLLCRNCAIKVKQYVDKKHQAAQTVSDKNCESRTDNHAMHSQNVKSSKRNSPRKRLIAALLAIVIALSGATVGILAIIKKNRMNNGANYVDEESIGEIYYQETPAEHIAKTDAGVMYADNELLVVAENGTQKTKIEKLAKKYDAAIVGFIEKTGDYQWQLSKTYSKSDLEKLVNTIINDKNIDSVSLNYFTNYSFSAVDYDIQYGTEYAKPEVSNLQDVAPLRKSWNLEAINAIQAWKFMDEHKTNINPIRIGLIDSGVDTSHEDLHFAQALFNSVGDHGTKVAGVMASDGENETGICGIYPYCDKNSDLLYSVSVPGVREKQGNETSCMWEKISFAELILRNVKVINCSYAFTTVPYEVKYWSEKNENEKIKEIYDAINNETSSLGDFLNRLLLLGYDFVITPGAGNEYNNSKEIEINGEKVTETSWKVDAKLASRLNNISQTDYPQLYNRIIVVGAATHTLEKADYSNGGDRVDVLAPGGNGSGDGSGDYSHENVYTTKVNSKYGYVAGTSIAAPHVSGLAADVWSINNNLSGEQVKNIIIETANIKIANSDANAINAEAAVKRAYETIGKSSMTDLNNGSIFGFVVDNEELRVKDNVITAGAIADANIIVKNTSTGEEVEGTFITDDSGHFEFILPPGKYILTINAAGYEPYTTSEPVEVYAQQVTYLDDWIKLTKKEDGSMEATEADFKELQNMFNYILTGYVVFDVSHPNAGDEVTDILFRAARSYTLIDYYLLSGEMEKSEDGAYSGKDVDNIQKNLFGVTPNHHGSSGVWFYKDNKYFEYIPAIEGPPPREAEIISRETDGKGNYVIKVRSRYNYNDYFDYTGYGEYEYYTVKAKVYELNGKRQWRILSIKFDRGESLPIPTTSRQDYAVEYKEAYRQFMLSYSDDGISYNSHPWFSFAYLDNDDIPELLIAEGYHHMAGVRIFTYQDSKVQYVDRIGAYGAFQYVEHEGVIFYQNEGFNYFSFSLIEFNNGKTSVTWSAYQHDSYNAANDDFISEYYVNDNPVSEDEFIKAQDKKTPANLVYTKSLDETGAYEFTYTGIMSFK